MTELSPAAQAVLDAFLGDSQNTGLQMDDLRENVAAALRALAKQSTFADTRIGVTEEVVIVVDILKIATELEQV